MTLEFRGAILVLSFEFDDEGVRRRSGLRFEGVRAHGHRAEGVCTAWHVAGNYDTVAEVVDSAWREELEALAYERGHDPGELHHFMIYIDSDGCYEVVARSWSVMPTILSG